MTMHRVSVLGSRLRRCEDPQYSRDPRVRAVVGRVQSLPAEVVAPPPRAHFRAELRAQLVAVAPRIVAEAAQDEGAVAERGPEQAAPPEKHPFLGRRLGILGAVLALCLVLFGGVVWESQKALPGDALYGLKRAGEDVRLAFSGSDTARAKDYLGFAGTRVEEAQGLVRRALPAASGPVADGGLTASTESLVRSTLGSADADVRSASRLLTGQAARSDLPAPLATMRHWAPEQISRLRKLRGMLPAGALRQRAERSAAVVRRAEARAVALSDSLQRGCLARSGTDAFGTEPCSATPPPGRTHRHGTGPARHQSRPGTHRTGGSGGSPSAARRSGATRPATGHRGGTAHSSGAPGRPSLTVPGLPTLSKLPSLPLPTSSLPTLLPTSVPKSLPAPSLPTPSLPISVGSCGASLPLGITLGKCPGH